MILTLVNSRSRKKEGGGFVLYGLTPGITRKFRGNSTEWLEKWFPTEEKALKYGQKMGANIDIKTA